MLYQKLATGRIKDIKTSSISLLKLIDKEITIFEDRIEVNGEIFVTDNTVSISFVGCDHVKMNIARKFLSDIDGFSIVNRYTRLSDPENLIDITAISMSNRFDSIKIEVSKNQEDLYNLNGYWKCSEKHLFPDYKYENNFDNLESSVAVYLRE